MCGDLEVKKIDPAIIQIIHGKLHSFLQLGGRIHGDYDRKICQAVIHQNIIGWHQFLCGFVSTKWQAAQLNMGNQIKNHWEGVLIKAVLQLQLHMEIWQDQNR
jgi:hypothetical protein